MPRKAPPQPLAGGSNDGGPIDKAPASAQSLRSPTSPEVPLSRWGVNRSDDNMRQTSFMAGTRPELNPRSVSNDSGTIYDAGIETSPAKTGLSKYFGKSKKKDKDDGKRPATAKDGKSRDDGATLASDMTALDLGSDRSHSGDARPSTAGRALNSNRSDPVLNKHHTMHIGDVKGKKEKHGFLGRKNSKKEDDAGGSSQGEFDEGPRTAPLRAADNTLLGDSHASVSRNRSADRQPAQTSQNVNAGKHNANENARAGHTRGAKSVFIPTPAKEPKEKGTKSSFFSNAKGAIGKGAKAVFMQSKEGQKFDAAMKATYVPDAPLQLKVVNQPLIEQTRITRISKQLETSRDKTEFWMPAIAWRLIDFLNYRGTESEGLYRISGGHQDIKRYMQRFDTEYDVDLFTEENLYDINTVGSLLKSWLRELPEPLFPQEAADRVIAWIRAHEDLTPIEVDDDATPPSGPAPVKPVPKVLIDELSNLPPYNYYTLFALTCHLSLVVENREVNMMSFSNLLICFRPSMRIDPIIFKYLVMQWRECWVGCTTERRWMKEEEEYAKSQLAPVPDEMGQPFFGHGRQNSAHSGTTLGSHHERSNSAPGGGEGLIDMDESDPSVRTANRSLLPTIQPLPPMRLRNDGAGAN